MKVGAMNPAGLQSTLQLEGADNSQVVTHPEPQLRALLQYEPHLRLFNRKINELSKRRRKKKKERKLPITKSITNTNITIFNTFLNYVKSTSRVSNRNYSWGEEY